MPLHATMSGVNVHEDKLISTATVADAGKVTTPSSALDGAGELRRLLGTELDTGGTIADQGKVLTPSATADGEFELRYATPDDIDALPLPVDIEFADIGTLDTQYTVLPFAATSIRFYVILYAAITGADETVTVTVGTATGITLVVPVAGSGVGVVTAKASTALSAAQAAGVKIVVNTAGTSTGATRARVVVVGEN